MGFHGVYRYSKGLKLTLGLILHENVSLDHL